MLRWSWLGGRKAALTTAQSAELRQDGMGGAARVHSSRITAQAGSLGSAGGIKDVMFNLLKVRGGEGGGGLEKEEGCCKIVWNLDQAASVIVLKFGSGIGVDVSTTPALIGAVDGVVDDRAGVADKTNARAL